MDPTQEEHVTRYFQDQPLVRILEDVRDEVERRYHLQVGGLHPTAQKLNITKTSLEAAIRRHELS